MIAKKIGFIGGGNMGSAIIGGILSSGMSTHDFILASAHTQETRERLTAAYGILTTAANEEVAAWSDILFLCIKPNKFDEVLPEIAGSLKPDCLVISIAAGKTLSSLSASLGEKAKLVRAMPNTPALVGEAMSALTPSATVSDSELETVQQLFQCFGKSEVVPESLMDAVTGVSGSSPAYVYLFIEAMADAAVADGMPRAQAYKFAAQSVYGAAKMVLETGKHPGELKDAVCSPGGTTIEAVASLEKNGLRSTVIEAQRTCSAKSKAMSQSAAK